VAENLLYLAIGLIRRAGTESSRKVGPFHEFGTCDKPGRGVRSDGVCRRAP
jgi:hypothetical protein